MTNFLVSVLITYATMHQCLLPRVVNIPKDSIKVKIDLLSTSRTQNRERLCQLCAQVDHQPAHRKYRGKDRAVGVEYLNICLTGLEQPWQAYYVPATPT